MRLWLVVLPVLAGCAQSESTGYAEPSPFEQAGISAAAQPAETPIQRHKACLDEAAHAPEGRQAIRDALASRSPRRPTRAELRLIPAYGAAIDECRQRLVEEARLRAPRLVGIFELNRYATRGVWRDLASGGISYADARARLEAGGAETRASIQAAAAEQAAQRREAQAQAAVIAAERRAAAAEAVANNQARMNNSFLLLGLGAQMMRDSYRPPAPSSSVNISCQHRGNFTDCSSF